jgi:hypothetical protein
MSQWECWFIATLCEVIDTIKVGWRVTLELDVPGCAYHTVCGMVPPWGSAPGSDTIPLDLSVAHWVQVQSLLA